MPNVLADAIAYYRQRVEVLGGSSELEGKLALSWEDWCAYQDLQARAHAAGRLTADDAMMLYRLLGGEVYHSGAGNGGWPRGVGLAEKIAATMLLGMLLFE